MRSSLKTFLHHEVIEWDAEVPSLGFAGEAGGGEQGGIGRGSLLLYTMDTWTGVQPDLCG